MSQSQASVELGTLLRSLIEDRDNRERAMAEERRRVDEERQRQEEEKDRRSTTRGTSKERGGGTAQRYTATGAV